MKRLRAVPRWFARRFGYARAICLLLLLGFAGLRVADPALVQELRVRTFDNFQVLSPRVKTVRPVTIVDIDEKSLADPKLGQWPWPRTRIAEIIDRLTRLGAVVIAFDVVFAEPDRLNPALAAETVPNLDEATRDTLRTLPPNDQVLAEALQRSRVVLDHGDVAQQPRKVPHEPLCILAAGRDARLGQCPVEICAGLRTTGFA
ncbi:CHASE2 domain-containing protein, partial [Bradyrhizobium sp.]|uniref:CHASE2 domain-containing protein n=1 Tax=Bradyrhizobium sp. TaxID=376 RepID=UPI00391CE4D6